MKLDIRGYDYRLILLIAIVQIIGLVGVFSATYKEGPSSMFLKHSVYLLMGWLLILTLSRINYRIFYDSSLFIYMLNLFLLVLVPLVGKTVYGAKRWIDLGPFNMQPSEFMKFSLILFLSYSLIHTKRVLSKETGILLLGLVIPTILTLKQPDLGTAITYLVVFVVLLFAYGVKLRYFIISGLILILTSPLMWHLLKDYQKERIIAVLDPYADYSGSGYQLIQSMIAVGSGGYFGKGFLEGTQAHLLFLPEKHTDFIFSVIAEEWGFFISFILLTSFFGICFLILDYALRLQDIAAKLFLSGAGMLMLFQVSVNLMMSMGMAPVVGIPLPFVSYGGSSIITFSLILGVCLSIVREYRLSPIKFHESKG